MSFKGCFVGSFVFLCDMLEQVLKSFNSDFVFASYATIYYTSTFQNVDIRGKFH